MAFVPLTPQKFGTKALRRMEGFGFARNVSVVPISAAEIPHAAQSMPIAFAASGGRHAVLAVMGLAPARNLFVAPDGRWIGDYVPATLRTYPLRLLEKIDAPADRVLCIDEGCDAIVDVGQGTGEPLFDSNGSFSSEVQKTIESMKYMERDRVATESAVAALAKAGVMRPWEVKTAAGSGGALLNGLQRIDEVALSQIDDAVFCGMRKSFALPLAYAHLLAMFHLTTLSRLEAMHAEILRRQAGLPETLDQAFKMPGEETLRFD